MSMFYNIVDKKIFYKIASNNFFVSFIVRKIFLINQKKNMKKLNFCSFACTFTFEQNTIFPI